MKAEEIENFHLMKIDSGVIESTVLGSDGSNGDISFVLDIKMMGAMHTFGGQRLCSESDPLTTLGSIMIVNILSVTGADKWESIKGKKVRVIRESEKGPIIGIGHIHENRWFLPRVAFPKIPFSLLERFNAKK